MKLIEEFRSLPESKQRSVALTLAIAALVLVIGAGAFVAEDVMLAALEGEDAAEEHTQAMSSPPSNRTQARPVSSSSCSWPSPGSPSRAL